MSQQRPAHRFKKRLSGRMIELARGDILNCEVDAVVLSAHPTLVAGSGMSGHFHRQAGPELEETAHKLGPLGPGNSVVTDGFNLRTPLVVVNQLLQGQGENAFQSSGRFIVNSTVGIFGLFDVAEKIGLEEKEEDYGQTLATWGVGDGFYIVLPLFGPSNLRDTSGMVLTMLTDPINAYAVSEGEAWLVPMRTAVNAVDTRSQIIDEVNALRDNSVDYYAAVRSSYYQNRKAAINNVDDSELTPLPLISIEFE